MHASHARSLVPRDDNAALLSACRAGDPEAWEHLIRRYQRLIYAIPRRAGLSEEDAGEVFQRVCIVLFRNLERIDRPERLGAWLATTARRESWRQLRGLRVAESLDQSDDDGEAMQVADGALLPDEVLDQLERQQEVRLAVRELNERCRRLVILLFYQPEPPSYAAIAAALGVPEGSIGPTRARCLRKLQLLLEEREG